VLNREKQGSTFFNEGIALPHARIEGLDRSFIAIGITRKGLTDVLTERPMECIVLILTPVSHVNEMIELLAKVSKFFGNRRFMKDCREAKGPADIVSAIWKREAEERS
jgi:mannitol/fructose-specific phosphotransferase system IIA component (Ntr-type)